MGTSDTSSGRRFERRIGRRVVVDGLDVTFFVPETGRFRKKVAAHEVPARIENVSITGAAILASSSLPWDTGERVVVRSQGTDNLVIVRHRHDTPSGTRFGVELTRSATTLKRQIREVLDPHLSTEAPPAPPRGPVLGLHRSPVATSPVLPTSAPPPAEAPSAEPPTERAPEPVAPAAALHGPGPVIDLSGPEPVIDLTDSVMGVAPRPSAPSPGTTVAPPDPAEPTAAEPVEAPQTEAPERSAAPHAPAPRLPHSAGRQVLDDVFGLMDD